MTYQDEEVTGLDPDGCVIQWDATKSATYNSGMSASQAFSVFANDEEYLPARKAAAKTLCASLASRPESQVQGPARTAMIKCELAARYGQYHKDVDGRFVEVSSLLYQAQVKL